MEIIPPDLSLQWVFGRFILMLQTGVNFERETSDFRKIDTKLAAICTEIAHTGGRTTAELAGWRSRDNVNCATFGIASKQGSLRTFQNLNALYIQKASVQTMLTSQIYAVNIDAYALFAGGLIGVTGNNTPHADR